MGKKNILGIWLQEMYDFCRKNAEFHGILGKCQIQPLQNHGAMTGMTGAIHSLRTFVSSSLQSRAVGGSEGKDNFVC